MKVILFILFFSSQAFSSESSTSRDGLYRGSMLERFKKIQESMEDMLGDDSVDLFKSMKMNDSLNLDWKESKSKKTLQITLPHKDQNVDVKIKNNMITINGDLEIKKIVKNKYGESTSISKESISRAFPVPEGCDPKSKEMNLKNKDDKKVIEVSFKCSQQSKGHEKESKPLFNGEVI